MKIIVPILLLFFMSHTGFADSVNKAKPIEKPPVCQVLKKKGATKEELARSGCCSWHQGVCGCSGGRQVCCDGSYSPSCTCNKEEPPKVPN